MGLHPRDLAHMPVIKDKAVVRLWPTSTGKQSWGNMTGFWELSWLWPKLWPAKEYCWDQQLPLGFSAFRGLLCIQQRTINCLMRWFIGISCSHTHLASGWKEEIIYEAYRRSLAELELNTTIKNAMSEHLGLSWSSLTTGLISASLKVGENCSHKVCKRCNVIKNHQTYCKELINEDLTTLWVGNTITDETADKSKGI